MRIAIRNCAAVVAAVIVVGSAARSLPAYPAGPTATSTQLPSFLSFAPGEERRYVLGPPEELHEEELGTWSIRLRELLGDPPDGIFELTHSWRRGDPGAQPEIGAVMRIDSSGEVRVNPYGFPLEVTYETHRHLAGIGEEAYTVQYRFQDGAFVKRFAMEGEQVEHPVAIRNHDNRDLSVPRGVYAFEPNGPDCSIPYPITATNVRVVRPGVRTAGSDPSPPPPQAPLRVADNRDCVESLFFNPGLISLMLPVLWEEGTGEHEFVLLTPAGNFGMDRTSVGVAGFGVGAQQRDQFDAREARSMRVNSDVETLRYVERTSVPVGPRTHEAWLFRGMWTLDNIYVDDDGVVLRVDLADHFWQRLGVLGLTAGIGSDQLERRRLYVRLLHASEY